MKQLCKPQWMHLSFFIYFFMFLNKSLLLVEPSHFVSSFQQKQESVLSAWSTLLLQRHPDIRHSQWSWNHLLSTLPIISLPLWAWGVVEGKVKPFWEAPRSCLWLLENNGNISLNNREWPGVSLVSFRVSVIKIGAECAVIFTVRSSPVVNRTKHDPVPKFISGQELYS